MTIWGNSRNYSPGKGCSHEFMLSPAARALLLMVPLSLTSSIIPFLEQAMGSYGYLIVFVAIMVESMGVPFPGETMLLVAAAYSAQYPELSIYMVIACAAFGAIVGDNLGYWIGREGGSKLIRK